MLRDSLLVDVKNWAPKEKEEAMKMCRLGLLRDNTGSSPIYTGNAFPNLALLHEKSSLG